MSVSKHIFIAEDEANISDFLKRGLEDCGYEVSVASNGNEAWLMMEDGMLEERFCMLLLDIRMPGMNGLELCKRFRSHFGYKVPVLMLTALDRRRTLWQVCMPGRMIIWRSRLSLSNCLPVSNRCCAGRLSLRRIPRRYIAGIWSVTRLLIGRHGRI